MKKVLSLAAAMGLLSLAGCGGGGDDGDGMDMLLKSQSFSPITALAEDGSRGTLIWRYRVNGGNALAVSQEGITLSMSCSDLELTIDPDALQRRVNFSASVSGNASGRAEVSVIESLAPDSVKTLINRQLLSFAISISADGQSGSVSVQATAVPSEPIEWFLDRTDLDTLATGYTFRQQSVSATLSGTVTFAGNTREISARPASYNEVWTVTGKQDAMEVNGKTYRNIVQVERHTWVPDIGLSGSAEAMTLTYWVAKGVGMIRGVGQYSLMGKPLTVELVESNLVQ